MDGKDASSTPRKALWRSASWTARSSPTTASNSVPSRPPKPGRAALPRLQPLAITRPPLLTEWPRPACDDAGHCPSTPSTNLSSGSNYFADRECSRVAEHVYLGSDAAARDREVLRRHGITHVLNCVGSACPEYFRGELIYKTLWLHDSPAEDITSVLYDAFDYLEEARLARQPGRVLVHCLRGASRSAALVIAYLMWHRALPFEDALRAVRAARAVTDPNLGFASQLLQCQSRVHALPPSPGSPRRAYRMAPHSPYDPLHLVPKTVDCPSPARLDSRGAFVVHVPSVIYIWLGQHCERAMAASAATAACQIVRYERAQGPVITVHEGSEPSEFWEALQDPVSPSTIESMGLGVSGRRRVDLYDLDFEIFRRALKGGIVPPLAMTGSSASPTHLPARDSGWSWLRHKFQSGGAKEFVMEPNEEEEVKDAVRSPGSLSVESTTTVLFSSADSASPPSTFSPISSSSSDWYNLSPPGSKFISGLPPLHPTKETKKNSTCSMQSLAERRGSNAPSLVLPLPASDKSRLSPREIVRDWCLSPPFVSEMELDGGAIYIEQPASDAETDENVDEEDNLQLIHPVLFRWPSMDKVEVIQAEVLDSRSVFLLLAPDSNLRMRKHRANILYLWLGKHSNIISCGDGSDMREEDEKVRRSSLEKIRLDLLDPLELPLDTPVQIIREGEEPEQFLNYLFSFHLPENSSSQLEE